MTKEVKIIIGIAVVVIVGGITLFMSQPKALAPTQNVDGSKLIREGSHMTGSPTAKVQVVEFADIQCPACAQAAPILTRLREEYKGNNNVNFVFRHYPLPQHGKAMVSAAAAEAAGKQGKFWEMVDKLYAEQVSWANGDDSAVFLKLAQDLGLNIETFRSDSNPAIYQEIISADKQDGEDLGVNSTPTIFINGEKAVGYQYEYLKATIEEALKK
jgi:protein-disulfide isomerase